MPQPKNWSEHANTTRLEDLTFMADTGEHATGAARRLGITPEALEKWCARNGHTDLHRTLIARNPHEQHNPRNQHTAA